MSSDRREKPNRAKSAFIHHLIPVATAAGLTFTACGPTETTPPEPNVIPSTNSSSGMDMRPSNNQGSADMGSPTPDMNTPTPTPDLGPPTPDMNTLLDMGGADMAPADMGGANDMAPPQDQGAADMGQGQEDMSGGEDMPAADMPPPEDMGQEDMAAPDMAPDMNMGGAVTFEAAKLRAFCQSWETCDAMEFASYFTDVDECTMDYTTYVNDNLSYLQQTYNVQCAEATRDFYDDFINTFVCNGGAFEIDQAAYDAAYMNFAPKKNLYCSNP